MLIAQKNVETVGLDSIAVVVVMQTHIMLIKIFQNLIELVVRWKRKE